MIKTIDEDELHKVAMDWIWDNKLLYLNMMDRYIQRTDYKFPLDIKDLEEIATLDPAEVKARYTPIYLEVSRLPDKEKRQALEKLDEKLLADSARAQMAAPAKALLKYLNEKPEAMIKELNSVLYDLMVQAGDEEKEDFYPPEFEILNLETTKINNIGYEDVQHLKAINGWIAYLENPPHIEYTEKYYTCRACGNSQIYENTPKVCDACGYSKGLVFDAEHSKGEKVQELYVMENYEDVYANNSRNTEGLISVLVTDSNINKYQIGDKIKVTGVVKTMRKKNNMFLALRAMNITISGNEHLSISKEEEKEIMEIARNPFNFIKQNFASSIVGERYDIIKESLALAIAGGSDSEKRKNIHILMVGNPGGGKSELLKAVERNSPKAFYVSDTSGPGLTAAITDMAGSKVMVPGILVLANNGVACLDELDKMKREDTQAMHSAMEQGEFVKSKAGLKMKFITKTSIIAAANPVNSSFDPTRTIIEQITLPESLLQRFDIIWILLEDGNMDARAILEGTEKQDNGIIKKYFSYIQRINPDISSVINQISDFFNEIRSKSGDLAINARVLLAMKRIVQASAKMHLRESANTQDVDEMKRIISAYLVKFNFSVSNIYMPDTLRDKIWRILDLFKSQKRWDIDSLQHQSAMEMDELDRCLTILKRDGKIMEPRNGRFELI
jgi:replicative DNA helicase Mcm